MRILIIDDSPERGDRLRSRLDELGRSARWVRDPLFAITLLAVERHDAVLIAADLPSSLASPELCQILRGDPEHAGTIVLLYDTSRTLSTVQPEAADGLVREPSSVARLARLLVEELGMLEQLARGDDGERRAAGSLLHGSLDLFDVSELIQMVCRPGRSFRLTLHFDVGDAVLTVARGSLVHAELNHICGESAVKRSVSLGSQTPSTRFSLLELPHHVADSTPPTIDVSVPELLLRTSVALDEEGRSSREGSES
ncbi:MAG: DUF4388 domain-containing protein [Acidobacteriota bacterium]